MCWWYYGGPFWGLWWIFPLIGIGFMIVMILVMSRAFRGRIGMCGALGGGEIEELRRENRALREELERVKNRA